MFFLFLILSAVALEPSALSLKSLSDASVKKIPLDSKKRNVFVIFQKNCSACRKQVKELACLKESSKVFLIGAFSSQTDLRKEYRVFNTEFEGFYGDHDFLKKFKITNPLTPQIIFAKNKVFKKVLGFKTCKELITQQSL